MGLPLVWGGDCCPSSAKVSADLLAFNDVYRKSAENVGGSFVDIWDGFVDENGAFVMNGPDIERPAGQFRAAWTASASPAGASKVAFYVEKPLNKILAAKRHSQGPIGAETVGLKVPPTSTSCGRNRWRSTIRNWMAARRCWAKRAKQRPRRARWARSWSSRVSRQTLRLADDFKERLLLLQPARRRTKPRPHPARLFAAETTNAIRQ